MNVETLSDGFEVDGGSYASRISAFSLDQLHCGHPLLIPYFGTVAESLFLESERGWRAWA